MVLKYSGWQEIFSHWVLEWVTRLCSTLLHLPPLRFHSVAGSDNQPVGRILWFNTHDNFAMESVLLLNRAGALYYCVQKRGD